MRKNRKRFKRILGTSERPRLAVFRSLNNIYVQVIDDVQGKTLVSVSTLKMKSGGNVSAAKLLGRELAEKAQSKGIKEVVFDRRGYQYHGRVKALAESAREGGLLF